ncbi:hypothetical protein [Vibrio alfacsensis]|uniref:hypothetical protein n=1 Tax=Vibrio alfacsensis TaxID=1074311 RepID=UPI001BEF18F2|nr:hypothetical protein [Vibrio alfacsensis]WQE78557.1 hypothetical protein SO574_15530 [Vibrio alfacsensis]BCN26404.1 hypothetical protein VYA_35960 [Vibrio alfacsensis]
MKKLIIASILATSAIAGTVQANPGIGHIAASVDSFVTSSAFDMSERVEHKASNGLEINIHASRDNDNRVLVMDTAWSPFAFLTTNITEENAEEAAMEYAQKEGINVKLTDAKSYYYDGSYGYAFNVEQVK